jgi:hypothetical protein
MKRILFFLAVLLSVWSVSYADQTLNGRQPREWRQSTNDKILENKDYQGDTTAFTNVVATGHQALGNPGYIALVAFDGGSGQSTATTSDITYYLWVQQDGKLMIASFPLLKTYTSFPYGDWRSPNFPGTVVGSQS